MTDSANRELVADGKVKRGTGYWGRPFEAQSARAPFLDREPD